MDASTRLGARRHTARYIVTGVTVLLTLNTTAAAAEHQWTGERTLTCAGGVILHTVLSPGGFGTPFHLVDDTRVLIPRRAIVDGRVVIDQPGADGDANQEITCTYTDPAGRFIELVGLLSGG